MKAGGKEVMESLAEGVKMFLRVAVDSEGGSCNFVQIGWVGTRGMEAAVLGINFCPDEIKEVLNDILRDKRVRLERARIQ